MKLLYTQAEITMGGRSYRDIFIDDNGNRAEMFRVGDISISGIPGAGIGDFAAIFNTFRVYPRGDE